MQAIDGAALHTSKRYTPAEYLELEEQAEFRNEYHDGAIVAMTGGSFNHNTLTLNIAAFLKYALRDHTLRGQVFRPFSGDVKVAIPQYRKFTYPDVMVVQGEPIPYENRTDTLTNPWLIIEVLSKSTEEYDRSDKFKDYRSLSSLQEYVLVNQYEVEIQQYTKTDEGFWMYRVIEQIDRCIQFGSIGVEMRIEEMYERVRFSQSID